MNASNHLVAPLCLAVALAAVTGCSGGDAHHESSAGKGSEGVVAEAIGRLHLSWSDNDGDPIDCSTASIDTVRVRSISRDTEDGAEDFLSCADEEGTTSKLPAGVYSVTVELLHCRGEACANGVVIDREEPDGAFAVSTPGEVRDIGNVRFWR